MEEISTKKIRVLSQIVVELSCGQTDKQTNKQNVHSSLSEVRALLIAQPKIKAVVFALLHIFHGLRGKPCRVWENQSALV